MNTENDPVVTLTDNENIMHLVIPEIPKDTAGEYSVGEGLSGGCVCPCLPPSPD